MAIARRRLLTCVGGAIATPFVARPAFAQAYPSRFVRLFVGFPAGSSMDVIARMLGNYLSERLGQQFVVENRTGAGSNLAIQAVVNSQPDGYTLAVVGTNNTINTSLYEKLPFDFGRDIEPVAGLTRTPCVMVVHPSLPANTVPEFIAYAKNRSANLKLASGGVGTVTHVSGELFRIMTGVEMVHVPYRGSPPALSDLLAGHVDVMFDTVATSLGFINGGLLRALAVTASAKLSVLPETPPMSNFLPGYETSFWLGVGAPKGTPREIVDLLNREINAGLADEKLKSQIARLGTAVMPMTPDEFGQVIANDTNKWMKVVRFANIQAE